MSNVVPAKRITRLTSKNQENQASQASQASQANQANQAIQEEMTELAKKRTLIIASIKKIQSHFDDEEKFNGFSKGDLNERKKRLENLSLSLSENNMEMVCKEELSEAHSRENDQYDDVVMTLKAKASDRIDKIENDNKPTSSQAAAHTNSTIRVIQMDAAGNIPNTWGTFNGDYAKWQNFRDRWMPIHENKEIKSITKFYALKAACLGEAAGALGEWDITDDNYLKAFKRLSDIFEDDYMQIQAYMQKLLRIPRMRSNSSKAIRKMIDTVQQHIAGASRYINIDEKQPYSVFMIIDKMDSETFRAWEKHRPALAKAQALQNSNDEDATDEQEINNGANALRPGKHIPTWKELEEFLEGEVSIRVHEEKRNESDKTSTKPKPKQNSQNNFKNMTKKREIIQAMSYAVHAMKTIRQANVNHSKK